MEQRRMMLLDHERGALEREAQRLQVNLGLMRQVVGRGENGKEEEEGMEREKWKEGEGVENWVLGS
jgi:hypothetical protein